MRRALFDPVPAAGSPAAARVRTQEERAPARQTVARPVDLAPPVARATPEFRGDRDGLFDARQRQLPRKAPEWVGGIMDTFLGD